MADEEPPITAGLQVGHTENIKLRLNYREQDAFTPWRKYLYWKPGELKAIKRGYSRRLRAHVKSELRKQQQHGDE